MGLCTVLVRGSKEVSVTVHLFAQRIPVNGGLIFYESGD